ASGRVKAADKIDAVREFSPQHRLATLIVQISVAALTRKVAAGVVGRRVKAAGFGMAQAATLALPDRASTDLEAKQVRGGLATGGAGLAGHRGSGCKSRVWVPRDSVQVAFAAFLQICRVTFETIVSMTGSRRPFFGLCSQSACFVRSGRPALTGH